MELSKVISKTNPHCSEFKLFRLGRPGVKSRPLKVVLPDADNVSICLQNKRNLLDTNVRVSADLTPAERNDIKKAYEEMETWT